MIAVLVVEDEAIFRKGVVACLGQADDIKVVGEVDNGLDALQSVERLQPDLVLMDLNMPLMGGVEATRRIKALHPAVLVVVLTVSDLDRDLFEAVKAGADGYLLKSLGAENLTAAVRQAAVGDAPLSPVMAGKILKEFRQGLAPSAKADEGGTLTARELQVVQLATQGLSYKEIGAKLFVAESTVKNHMRHVMEKLHLRNRSQTISYALRHRLVEDSPPDKK